MERVLINYFVIVSFFLITGCNFKINNEKLSSKNEMVTYELKHGLNSKRYEQGLLSDGKREGMWIIYDENDFVVREERYKQGILNGPQISYSPSDSTISSISQYKDGNLHGTYIKISTNKMINQCTQFSNGEFDGRFMIFYKSGKLRHLHNYKNGKREGMQIDFTPEGDTLRVRIYKMGNLIEERGSKNELSN